MSSRERTSDVRPSLARSSGSTVSATLYLALIAVTFASVPVRSLWLTAVAAGLFASILLIELPRVALSYRLLGLALIAIGALCATASPDPLALVSEGVRRAQFFVLLFAAVSCLRYPAQASPALLAARDALNRQPPGQRFVAISAVVHVVGAVLNLLALALFSDVLRQQKDEAQKRRFMRAILGGFLSASCWSPYFLGMTVVHLIYPDVAWLSLLPLGLAIALALNLANWGADRLFSERPRPASASGAAWAGGDRLRLGAIVALLTSSVIALVELAGFSAPVAIAIVAPPFGLLWTLLIGRNAGRAGSAVTIGGFARAGFAGLPGLRNETVLFLGANIMAAGLTAVVPPNLLAEWMNLIAPAASLKIAVITLFMALLGLLGLHPVVIVVLVAQVVSPQQLGLSTEIMAALLLAMWGVTTALSPLSAVILVMARLAELSPWTLAWRWNLPYALAAAVIVIAATSALHGLIG